MLSQRVRQFASRSLSTLPDFVVFFLFSYVFLTQVAGILKVLYPLVIVLAALASFLTAFLLSRSVKDSNYPCDRQPGPSLSRYRWVKTIYKLIPISVIAVYTFSSLIVALCFKPNNWDSMTYHIPRMEHWYQNHSMWFYITNIDRQLWMQQLNSQLFLIPKALRLPDVSYNLFQWFAYVLIIVIVYKTARSFGSSGNISLCLAAFVCTIPNLIAESTTTQSDVLSALLVLLTLRQFFIILISSSSKRNYVLFGFSYALTAYAKGTTFSFLAIIGIALAIKVVREKDFKHLWVKFSFAPITVMLNSFLWIQSFGKFHSLSGPQSTSTKFLQSPLASNFSIPNAVISLIHFTTTNLQSFFTSFNNDIFRFAYQLAKALGLNLLSTGTAWPNWNPSNNTFTYIFQTSFGINEDSATSPHMILVLIVLAALFTVHVRRIHSPKSQVLTVAFLYFVSVVLILRWNPFVDRYYIPATIIGIFAIGLLLSNSTGLTNLLTIAIIIFGIYSLPFAFRSDIRPLLGSNGLITKGASHFDFGSRFSLQSDFEALDKVLTLSHPSSIALAIHGDDWEYPIWRLANNHKIRVVDYRDARQSQGPSPLLVCYLDCLDASGFKYKYIIQAPVTSKLGTNNLVQFANIQSSKVLSGDWASPENWGIWSNGSIAKMTFDVAEEIYSNTSISLKVRSLIGPASEIRTAKISVNGSHFRDYDLNSIGQESAIDIPYSFIERVPKQTKLTVEFQFKNLKSPMELGLGSDSRKLGIGVYSLQTIKSR